ncbi:MAG: hypothetical protein FJ266_06315 [Planctomycetes bacterium]|nr:hypothetical protein [Planctomycetota bacterium]
MIKTFQVSNSGQRLPQENRISGYLDLSSQEGKWISYSSISFNAQFTPQTNYVPVLSKRDTLELARNIIHKITDSNLLQQAVKLLSAIQNVLNTQPFLNIITCIPYLHAATPEDGSLLFEWISNDYRIGFHIEPNPQESSWSLVTKENLGEIIASGSIADIDLHKLVSWLLYFIISHL